MSQAPCPIFPLLCSPPSASFVSDPDMCLSSCLLPVPYPSHRCAMAGILPSFPPLGALLSPSVPLESQQKWVAVPPGAQLGVPAWMEGSPGAAKPRWTQNTDVQRREGKCQLRLRFIWPLVLFVCVLNSISKRKKIRKIPGGCSCCSLERKVEEMGASSFLLTHRFYWTC